jgi:CRP-like cAMP-binding protein
MSAADATRHSSAGETSGDVSKTVESPVRIAPPDGVDSGTWRQLLEAGTSVTFRRGATVFRAGSRCDSLHLIERGRIKVYCAGQGREQVMGIERAGAMIGEVGFFNVGIFTVSARALEDSRILRIAERVVLLALEEHPGLRAAMVRIMARRAARMVRMVERIALNDVTGRVASFLLECAETEPAAQDGSFLLPRTHQEMANELATTRESVARALSRLTRDGLIAHEGRRFWLLQMKQLESCAHVGGHRPTHARR